MLSLAQLSNSLFLEISRTVHYVHFATHALCNTCTLQYIHFATSALYNTYTLQHMHFVTCALCNTCNLQNVQFPTPVIYITCNLQHMKFSTPAISNTCNFQHMQFSTHEVCRRCKVRHVYSESNYPIISIFPSSMVIILFGFSVHFLTWNLWPTRLYLLFNSIYEACILHSMFMKQNKNFCI